ncbi:MAG: Succinyl-CoA synthetase [Candidatus Carbobacillus altaicus]|uniref:Succinyl-CoA synthetase n=1 Tax=Candidatus Carbonibacillus altaicus TaxID=2163959 RepID=A0A2R6XZB7_9BACL|nr:MAG: Succinyl-CoA synthetase [Candidatus Carbobacillus altaicus]
MLSGKNMSHDEQAIKRLLETSKRIAVVGLSDKPERDSYRVAEYLLKAGYEIIPVNPRLSTWLGQKAVARLEDIEGPVDIVDVFRRGEETPPIAEKAVAIGAKALWLQLGIHNDETVRIAQEGGVNIVTNRCIKVEHSRLLKG